MNSDAFLPADDDIVVSDLELDLEPDELVPRYLKIKSQLYEVRPDLVDQHKDSKSKKSRTTGYTTPISPGVAKIQKQMKQLESDSLFDSREADMLWLPIRDQMAEEVASKRRMKLAERPKLETSSGSQTSNIESPESEQGNEYENTTDEDDNALGDLFASVSGPINESAASSSENTDQQVTIRDFGQVRGTMPWRILEEACHSRYVSRTLPNPTYTSGILAVKSRSEPSHRAPSRSAIVYSLLGRKTLPWTFRCLMIRYLQKQP